MAEDEPEWTAGGRLLFIARICDCAKAIELALGTGSEAVLKEGVATEATAVEEEDEEVQRFTGWASSWAATATEMDGTEVLLR